MAKFSSNASLGESGKRIVVVPLQINGTFLYVIKTIMQLSLLLVVVLLQLVRSIVNGLTGLT